MSGGDNLGQQLGELTGHLKVLVPTLERVEERQNETDKKVAAAEAKHDAIRAEFNELKTKVSNRVGELYTRIGQNNTDIQQRKNEIEAVGKDVALLKSKNEGFKQKAWDLLKILITVIVTVLATKLLGK